jgi:predicted nucleic acid-binding protein
VPIVLDGSVALVWAFDDEQNDIAEAALDYLASDDGVVPAIWPLEIVNGLLVGRRRGRLSAAAAHEFVEKLLALPIQIDTDALGPALDLILALGGQYNLTSYDASYLELAMRTGSPLATLDDRLRDAASQAGVALITPS